AIHRARALQILLTAVDPGEPADRLAGSPFSRSGCPPARFLDPERTGRERSRILSLLITLRSRQPRTLFLTTAASVAARTKETSDDRRRQAEREGADRDRGAEPGDGEGPD